MTEPASPPPRGPAAEPEEEPIVRVQRFLRADWGRSSFWEILREVYFRFDRRALGFTRILIGFYFLCDLFHRTPVWNDMYSNIGVLPTHLNLQRPLAYGAFSIFNAFESPTELVLLWVAMFASFFCLMVGYKTKLAQIMSMVFVASMNGRVLLIENGGYVVHNLLAMWTCFLPMGDRLSLDAFLASMKRRREATDDDLNDRAPLVPEDKRAPHYSLLGPVLFIQIASIYFFNYLHKTGPAWHNGTAVHYVLYVDRMVTPIVGQVRDYIPNWAVLFMTRSTIGMELILTFVLFSPILHVWCRRAVVFMMNTLHIAFGTSMVLGPFAWACCLFSTLLFTTQDVELALAMTRRPHRARTVVFDRSSGGALLVCRVLARLDGYELLTFKGADDVEMGIRVLDLQGKEHTWNDAIAEIVQALPLGPNVAWLFRAPGVKQLVNAFLTYIDDHEVSAFFGLAVPKPVDDAYKPGLWDTMASVAHALFIEQLSPIPRAVRFVLRSIGWLIALPFNLIGKGIFAVFGLATDLVKTSGDKPKKEEEVEDGRPIGATYRSWIFASIRELGVAVMFFGAVNQAGTELWVINRRWHVPQPEISRLLSLKLRFLQGWFMFSPNPVMDDGTLVVDAVTEDGRHVDPFSGEAPNYNLLNMKSYGYSQIWCDYLNRIHLPANTAYRDAMKDYIYRYQERTGNPKDKIVKGEVLWVQDMNPKWNDTKSWKYEQVKLFSFERPANDGRSAPQAPVLSTPAPARLGPMPGAPRL